MLVGAEPLKYGNLCATRIGGGAPTWMREQPGASRRTSQCPWNRTHGSCTRMAVCTSFGPYSSSAGSPLNHAHADVRMALASRATYAPFQDESARIRGCPKLPSPAIRRFNTYAGRGLGNDPSSRRRTSAGGLAVYGGFF